MTNGDNGTRIMNELFYSVSNLLNWSEFPVEERQVKKYQFLSKMPTMVLIFWLKKKI
jgi:hypothetical protein